MLNIITICREHYKVNEKGQIIRQDRLFHYPTKNWKLEGIGHVRRKEFIHFSHITPSLIKELTLLYKNGYPQYTIIDYDYGTLRRWGNTNYYGIRYLYFDAE